VKTARRTDRDELQRILYAAEGQQRHQHAQSNPAVLRASGLKIERTSPEKMRIVAGNRQPWQANAWGYRDLIGELRYALEYRARAIQRARLFVAQINPDNTEDEPIALSYRDETDDDGNPTERAQKITIDPDLAQAAEDELARLPLSDGYGFLGVWSVNFDVAGEAWLHGRRDPKTGQETWQVRAVTDVDVQGSTITLKNELGQPRALDLANPTQNTPGTEEIYRLWIPHPAHPHLADSALRALADVLEEICLTGREMRALSRSRIANNGAWLLPQGMTTLLNTRPDTQDDTENQPSDFMSMLTAAMLAPITNEGDPGGVVPLILTGSREDIQVAKDSHIRFDRPDSPELINKLDRNLGRMATSLDIPAEVLTGLADTNHWTAWLIDSSSFRHHIEPSIRIIVDSHTQGMLRPALKALGYPPDQVDKLRTWYDAGNITENPNRRQDALDARAAGALGDLPFLKALGFSDSDAASREEQIIMAAIRSGLDPATAARVLIEVARQEGETELPEAIAIQPAQIGPARPPQQAPAAPPDETGVGGTGIPKTAPPGVTAAATGPTYRLNTDVGRRLMEIDRALRDAIIADTDQAIRRAIERAGSRLRAKATRDPGIAANMRDQPVTAWAAQLGRDQCFALGADVVFLLREAWDELRDKFTRRVRAAAEMIGNVVAGRLLRIAALAARDAAAERIAAAMTARIGPAWERYRDRLQADTEAFLFGEGEQEQYDEGELADSLIQPAAVRTVLAEIGGLPETSGGVDNGRHVTGEPINGLSNGDTVTRELDAAGVLTIGYLWVYGVTPQLRRFDPHWELEGERFTNWADDKLAPEPRYAWIGPFYHPGDHGGCMCDYVPGYAVPEYGAQVAERLATPTKATAEILALAADDDLAGRTGTTAQEIRDRHAEIQRLQARFMEGG
jgi:hypothetical protein